MCNTVHMPCEARFRPMRPVNDIEVVCMELSDRHHWHSGAIRDYAYQGSVTVMSWADDDRRSFDGAWPGDCPNCILPLGHHGDHSRP